MKFLSYFKTQKNIEIKMSQIPRNYYDYQQPQPNQVFYTEKQVGEICFLAQNKIQELENSNSFLRDNVLPNKEAAISQLIKQNDELHQQVKDSKKDIKDLEDKHDKILDRLSNIRNVLFEKEKTIKNIWVEKDQLKQTVEELKFALGQTRYKTNLNYIPLNTLKEKQKEWEKKQEHLEDKIYDLKSDIKDLEYQSKKQEQEFKKREQEFKDEIDCLNEQLISKNKYYLDKIQKLSGDLFKLSQDHENFKTQSKKRKLMELEVEYNPISVNQSIIRSNQAEIVHDEGEIAEIIQDNSDCDLSRQTSCLQIDLSPQELDIINQVKTKPINELCIFKKDPVDLYINVDAAPVLEVQGKNPDDWFYIAQINDTDKLALSTELWGWFTTNNAHKGIVRNFTDYYKEDVVKLLSFWNNKHRQRLCLTGKGVVSICKIILQRFGTKYQKQINTILHIVPSLVWEFARAN
jgi:hypothetical protein